MKKAFSGTQFKATFQGITDLKIHSKAFTNTKNSQVFLKRINNIMKIVVK
jgi:hypothetical protein